MNLKQLKKLSNTKVNFEVNIISNKIYHLHFKKKKDLASTFLRIQEFYESPKFQNKKITLDTFYSYYKKFKKGKFSYLTDWGGFNLPDYAFKKFIKVNPELSVRESQLFNEIKDLKKFYVIGTFGSKRTNDYKGTLDHELAHAFYYMNKDYKKQILYLLKDKDLSRLNNYFKSLGYNKKVFKDESHAYLISDFKELVRDDIISEKDFKSVFNKIKKVFNKEKES